MFEAFHFNVAMLHNCVMASFHCGLVSGVRLTSPIADNTYKRDFAASNLLLKRKSALASDLLCSTIEKVTATFVPVINNLPFFNVIPSGIAVISRLVQGGYLSIDNVQKLNVC